MNNYSPYVRSICFGLGVLVVPSFSHAAPRLVVTEKKFDFGFVPQNAQVSHNFWLKSADATPIDIAMVIPGCGCTKAPLEKTHIEPGDSSKLEIIYSSRSSVGFVFKSPSISLKGSTAPFFVEFSATVVQNTDTLHPLMIKPFSLGVTDVSPAGTFRITNQTAYEYKIKIVDFPVSLFTAKVPKSVPAHGVADGSITLVAGAAKESFAKSLTLSCVPAIDPAAKPVIYSMPVSMRVTTPATTAPTATAPTATDSLSRR